MTTEQVDRASTNLENLVFEGGGMRAVAFGGAVRFLEQHEVLPRIKRFAGSSAGAIMAAALALGYGAQEIITVLNTTDFERFKDDSVGVVLDVFRLLTQYGFYKGDALHAWVADLVEAKAGTRDLTFRQLHERRGVTLVITGTCLNRAETYYFHHESERFADMPIALAVRISMSIPLYWKAVKLDGDVLVDGGVLNNYPLSVFDGRFIGDPDVTDDQAARSKTLGFKLMMSSERRDSQLYNVDVAITGPVQYVTAYLNATLIQIERGHVRSHYWDRTVCINTHEIGTLDFALSREQKLDLVHEGYVATKNHFHCRATNTVNEMNRYIAR